MINTDQFLPIKEIYEQTRKSFQKSPVTIFPAVNGRMVQFNQYQEDESYPNNSLFIGNLIGEGPNSLEIVQIAMIKNLKVLRGTAEDTIVRLLDACEEGNQSQIHLYASILHANHGTRILLNFAGKSADKLVKDLKGKITHLGFLLPAIRDGILTPEEAGDAIATVLGIHAVEWMRSLPVAAIFPDSDTLTKIRKITVVSHGGLTSEIRQDICFSTEKIAVWGGAAPARSSSKSILYHLFSKDIGPELVSQREQMNYQANKEYVKAPHYSVSPGNEGDSISIQQITASMLRQHELETMNENNVRPYRLEWMTKNVK